MFQFRSLLQSGKKPKKSSDAVESSLTKITDTFTEYFKQKSDVQQQPAQSTQPSLKFAYIWTNLDNLFQQLDQKDVNDLNFKFITQTFEKINAKQGQ